jgi:hypothetical protein
VPFPYFGLLGSIAKGLCGGVKAQRVRVMLCDMAWAECLCSGKHERNPVSRATYREYRRRIRLSPDVNVAAEGR